MLGEQKNQVTLLSLCRDLNSPHILYSSDVLVPLEDWGPDLGVAHCPALPPVKALPRRL